MGNRLVPVVVFLALAISLSVRVQPVTGTEYLSEPFSTLDAWDDNTGSAYDVELVGGTAHFYGDGFCVGPYISNADNLDIGDWSGTMYLELDCRAKSDFYGSTVTNAYVAFYDYYTHEDYGYVLIYAGGTTDTGWQHKKIDISQYVGGVSDLELRLALNDGWSADWNQENWWDNVTLYETGGGVTYYGYFDVFDMNISVEYPGHGVLSSQSYHVQNVANRSNTVIVPDRIFHAGCFYNPGYDDLVVQNNLSIFFYVHPCMKYWFLNRTLPWNETWRYGKAKGDLDEYHANLTNENVNAIILYDEPVRGEYQYSLTPHNLSLMASVAREVWSDKPMSVIFHRQGDEQAREFGWYNHTDPYNFEMQNDTSGSRMVHIYGDGFNVGTYISRIVNIADWGGDMYLDLNFRAKSDYAESCVTNAFVDFYDFDTQQHLGYESLVAGGTYDTGYTSPPSPINVSDMLGGVNTLEIRLEMNDGWVTDWNQECWFDNVTLYSVGPDAIYLNEMFEHFFAECLLDFDTRAERLQPFSNWTSIDPYFYPNLEAADTLPISMVEEDADWAVSYQKPWVMWGQAFDPPYNFSAPFFEYNDWGDMIMPNETVAEKYYNVSVEKGAVGLFWFWYPSSFASSSLFWVENGGRSVADAWAAQLEIWEKIQEEG